MALDTGLIEWVREALAPIGTVTMRRMMGGATLYCDGTVFALLAFDELWFKADAESDAAWDAAGADRFTYEAKGRQMVMNYRRAPADAHDDAEALRDWAMLAIDAGRRAPPRTPRAGKKKG
ncbi:TfoX/Sxy family protein [Sphingomonas elodea]|uniref:TfoX/Sxy family protein n=1 Tax=Sphingomonas elodea TaxID=179878 RepID=UPI00026304F7|nr:TfoX/Sxy family protein [Sphingomonas elodea]